MKKKEQKALDQIMDWFDFENVAKTMEVLNWKWIGTEEGVPTIGEIKEQARRLLTQAIKERVTIGTGGFKATYNHKYKHLTLEFIVSEWDCEI
jgi:hypothetical protein